MSAADEEGKVSMGGRVFLFVDLRLRIGQCAEITVTPMDSTYPKTITIDFGNGCLGPDGKLRKGKIVITLTGPIRRPGSVATITLVDFFLNRAHIEGTKTWTNLSENGHVKFNVVVTGGKITFPHGRGYKYTSTKTVTQIEGATTNNIHDNVYSIAARSRTDFNNGLSINLNTESNFIKKVACYWVSDGVLKIKINNRVLFLDFGAPSNGNCDNKALLTWNNGAGQRLILLP